MSLIMRTIAPSLLALGMSALRRRLRAGAADARAAPADPAVAALDAQAARFAPTELSADVAGLPEPERQALAHMIRAAQVMDALFLRQVWAGNEAMLLALQQRPEPARPGPLALLPDQQGAVVAARPQRAVRARRARQAGGGQLLSRRRVARPRSSSGWRRCRRRPGPAATGFFTTIRRGAGGGFIGRALQRRVPGRAGAGGVEHLRGGGRSHHAAHPQGLPAGARRGVPQQRLLRQRREVDGARRLDRADHRPLRGLRGRVVQRQGGLRGVHHREGRRPSRPS